MKGPIHLTDPKVGVALLFVLSVLALVMMLTIKPKDEPFLYKKKSDYHTDGFDFGSFKRDMFILFIIALPFGLLYFLTCL